MKIIELQTENFKRLKAVEIKPGDAKVVEVTGRNGSGKSSVLDSIYAALAGTKNLPSKPIRGEEEKAMIRLDLGDIKVTRRFTKAGGTSLIVEAQDGARYPSPQGMLDDLIGSISFDPLAFTRMPAKAQSVVLRNLVPLEIDLDQLAKDHAADFATRTDMNRAEKQMRATAETITVTLPEGHELPAMEVDVSELLTQISKAAEHNAQIETRKGRRELAVDDVRKLTGEIESLKQRLGELEADRASIQKTLDEAEPLPEPIVVDDLRQQVEVAQVLNRAFQKAQERQGYVDRADEFKGKADALTSNLEGYEKAKKDALAAAKMPIDGLSIGEEELLYNDLPLDQASGAEQLRVSVAIAMAGNPKLKVLRVKDGSLLDDHGLDMLRDMAEQYDFQVWLERVDTSGKVGVVMEDGEVVANKLTKEPAGA